jgi:hypothetical protein
MKRLINFFALGALLVTGMDLEAQTAAFDNGVMQIPKAMVFLPSGNRLYRDLQLSVREDGNLEVNAWEQAANLMLASVQSVSVDSVFSRGDIAAVIIHGFKSAECVQLEDVQVNRQGNTVDILFAEKPVRENVRCIAGMVPFDRAIFLHTEDLPAGEMIVNVHDLQVRFTVQD